MSQVLIKGDSRVSLLIWSPSSGLQDGEQGHECGSRVLRNRVQLKPSFTHA